MPGFLVGWSDGTEEYIEYGGPPPDFQEGSLCQLVLDYLGYRDDRQAMSTAAEEAAVEEDLGWKGYGMMQSDIIARVR